MFIFVNYMYRVLNVTISVFVLFIKQILKKCNLCFFRPLSAFIAHRPEGS